MVDRVLFIPDKLNTLDGYRLLFSSITLRDILSCKGATSSNPSHHRRAPEASENIFGQAGGSLVSPAIDGSARGGATARSETIQSAKHLSAKPQQTRSTICLWSRPTATKQRTQGTYGLDHAYVGVLRNRPPLIGPSTTFQRDSGKRVV